MTGPGQRGGAPPLGADSGEPERPRIDPGAAKIDPGSTLEAENRARNGPSRPKLVEKANSALILDRFWWIFNSCLMEFGTEMFAEKVSATRAAQVAFRWRFR